jgi:hypothetical protein
MSNTVTGEELYDAYRFHETKLAELREKLKGTAFYASITSAKKSKRSKVKGGGGVTKKKKQRRTKKPKTITTLHESPAC